jgi:hypothetical protein
VHSAEPARSRFPYAGWIPTVAGRLSFRHIGESRHPERSVYANLALSDRRIILAYQKRPLSDVVLAKSIIHFILALSGNFWFVLEASSKEPPGKETELEGTIFIYKSREDWKSKAKNTIRAGIYALNDLNFIVGPPKDAQANALLQTAQTHLSNSFDISVEFVLRRNGDTYFSEPHFADPELKRASEAFAAEWAQELSKWVSDQAYFFLRDLCHKHQHHPQTDDTIIILQKRGHDEIEWRERVLFSLYYYIIGAKRVDEIFHCIRAIGVLAYCASFTENSKRQLGARAGELPVFNSDALLDSLKSRISDIETQKREIEAAVISNLSRRAIYFAAIASLIAAVAFLIQPYMSRSSTPPSHQLVLLNQIAVWVSNNILTIAGLIVLATIFIIGSTSRFVVEKKWSRSLLEIGSARPGKGVLFYFVLATAVLGGTIWWTWPVVKKLLMLLHPL